MDKQILSQRISNEEVIQRLEWLKPSDIKDICTLTNVSNVYISNVRTGKTSHIKPNVIDAIIQISNKNLFEYKSKIEQLLNKKAQL